MSRPPRHRKSGAGRKGRRKRPQAQVPHETLEMVIDHLGAQGDGVATALVAGREQTLYVPGALPDERVSVETSAKRGDGIVCTLLDVVMPSAVRVAPPCPHYAHCGGCALQHLSTEAYGAWKRDRIERVLTQRGFDDVEVREPILIGEGTRRRVTFTLHKRGKLFHLGFNARSSHDIVDIDACPLLVDDLNALIAPLRTALQDVLEDGARVRIAATACENGADVMVEATGSPDLAAREALAAFVQDTQIARLAWKDGDLTPEPIAQRVAPKIDLSGTPVELPSGAFLQACQEGEHAIRDAVLEGVGADARRVADLYCGLGSFSVPLAAQAIVEAYDATVPAVRALERGAGRANLGGRIQAHVRDLHAQPLDASELVKFDAVVFDPPRAGAAEQARQLGDADVARVVGVSCNPATFARDARILCDGGFDLIWVQPIDQFTYSAHTELVACFVRDEAS